MLPAFPVSPDCGDERDRRRATQLRSRRRKTRSSRERVWPGYTSWRVRSIAFLLGIEAGSFFQQDFFDPFPSRAADCDGEPRHLEASPRRRQITEPVENEAADCVEAFGFQLETEMLAQVVEARV